MAMDIQLEKAGISDANTIHELQVKAFLPLLRKYQDEETNPANEPVSRVIERLEQPASAYYFIVAEQVRIGAIRVVCDAQAKSARISPVFIVPEHQGKGYGQKVMALIERVIGADVWMLDTILEEHGNCYLYEKMGYQRIGTGKVIHDGMTLVSYKKMKRL